MKRSEAIEQIRLILEMNGKDNGYGELERAILHQIEVFGMKPKRHINPKAKADPRIDWGKGEGYAYMSWIDTYPDHHFTHKNQKPYEFYLDGWEDE